MHTTPTPTAPQLYMLLSQGVNGSLLAHNAHPHITMCQLCLLRSKDPCMRAGCMQLTPNITAPQLC
jgi:hypothetical protein